MDVKLPDGTIINNVPEGTTQSELMARVGKVRGTAPALSSETMPRESTASFGNLFGAAVEPMLKIGSGAVATPIQRLA